jgi:hypothetical protein
MWIYQARGFACIVMWFNQISIGVLINCNSCWCLKPINQTWNSKKKSTWNGMTQLFSQYLMWSKKFEIWRKLRSSQTFATTFLKPQNGDFMSLLSWMARVANKTHVIEKFLFYDIKSSKAMNNTTKNCVHSILMCLLSICNKKLTFICIGHWQNAFCIMLHKWIQH